MTQTRYTDASTITAPRVPEAERPTSLPEAAGIIATLYARSQLSFQYPTRDRFATRFHQLWVYALDHAQAEAIFAAID